MAKAADPPPVSGETSAAQARAAAAAGSAAQEMEKLRECLRSIDEARRLIPFLRSIIAAVPEKTEEAAFRLLEKFELVKKLTTEAAVEAKALDSADKGSLEEKVKEMSETSRRSLEQERAAVTEMVALNRGNAKELKDMGSEISSGLELLKGIEDISQKSHLIALNLSVEAAHIGSQGLGFKVIATELRSLNAQTGEFSQKVSALLDSLRRRSATIIGQMAEKSESVVAEAEKGMSLAAQALESLIAASTASHEYSARIAGKALRVNEAMDGVLESLQFQDITRQMLEGAGHIADEMEPLMRGAESGIPAGDGDSAEERARLEDLRARLLARAKTKGEKEAIMEVMP
jgi:methyl-accepting chemotaxis protein